MVVSRGQGRKRNKQCEKQSARQAGQDAMLDQALFKVKPKVYAQFLARLDAPSPPNNRLRRTMTAKAPWEK